MRVPVVDLPVPSPRRGGLGRGEAAGTRFGFTLIEVVLAIGLTAMVVYLLSMATESYLANVDSSRTRVETAQLARTLLDQIANDLANARVSPPAAASAGGQFGGGPAGAGGPSSGGAPAGGAPSNQTPPPGGAAGGTPPGGAAPNSGSGGSNPAAGPGPSAPPVGGEGIYGAADQIRIDRTPYANWERASRDVELQESATRADMPASVRYFFVDDNRLTTQKLAQQGIAREVSPTAAGGLYRETVVTATITPRDPALPTRGAVRNGAHVELLAPEVVAFELKYYNGKELVEKWDPAIDRGLPRAVEIVLTIAEPRFQARPSQDEKQRMAEGRYLESERVEYRRFVRLPLVAAAPPAQMLLPAAGGPGQGGAVQGGGQPGGGQGQGQGGQPSGGTTPGGTP